MEIIVAVLFACCLGAAEVAGIPEFLGPSSRTTYLDENSPAGTSVLTVYAVDNDGSTFSFSLMPTGQFSIDAISGEVVVATSPTPPLDRETTETINITINLNSGESVVQSLPVTVFLNDVNDNSPVWRNPISSIASPFPENTPVGTFIYTIVTSDADIGPNGNIRFRVQSPSDGTFAVNAESGVVRLARPLDYSTANTIGITIIAEDEGVPTRSATIAFSVSVSPVLSAPVFTQTHYSVDLVEGDYTTAPHSNLLTVVAVSSDPDATIVYSQVMRGVPNDALFSVTSGGVINVIGNIDREQQRAYDLQIEAYVSNTGASNSTTVRTLVTVNVLDINDNNPVFENPHSDPIILSETTPVSTVVYTFYATDRDEGTNSDITFEITSPTNGPFSIGATSGVIHLANTLNRDSASSYIITVRVQDGGSVVRRSSTTTLTVIVDDVVSAPPTFTESVYTFEIAEGSYSNEEVGIVRAVDAESPSTGVVRYEQVNRGDASDTLFTVTASGSMAGRIAVTGALDRETTSIYAINIRGFRVASSGSSVPLSEAATVSAIIIISDVNDNSPVWTSTFNPITISESHPVGTDIFTATATDADSGSNGRITYSFVSPQSGLPFSIDASSGVVRLSSVLDFDVQSSYTLTIQAQDGGSVTRFIRNTLSVRVEDALDLAPTFTESVYSVSVAEGTYSNEVIGSVRAVESIRPNAIIRYEKVSGAAIFSVASTGENAGAVTLSGSLDAETVPTYTVTIRAFRVTTGTTPRSDISTVSMVIALEDINDNNPVWTDPTPGPVSLVETRPVGSDVFVVAATDPDSGTNGEITYSLPLPVDGPFSIGASTGIIRLTGPLDFTVQSRYNLAIIALDGAMPPRNVTTSLTINIIDVLDPPPIFTESIYTEDIMEGVYTSQLVGTVRATDPLNPTGAVIRYRKRNTGDTLFSVIPSGSNAGQVTVTGSLDRESTSTYSISIEAFRVADDSSTSALSDVSVVSMLITVTDVNDNTPMFLNPALSPVSFQETRAIGSIIYTYHAIDLDSGSNGEITYSLQSPANAPFSVDSSSGVVRIQGILDYDVNESYTLTISASDGGTPARVASTTLTVNLVDVLDPPPTFTLRAYSVEVSEGSYTNHLLNTVEAVDTLHPTTAVIRYEQIPKGDMTDSLFQVVSSGDRAGQVLLSGTVNQGVGSYFINIRAFRVSGMDLTPRSGISTVSMTITITDVNDNSPVFLNPRSTPISVIETRPIGTVLYTYHVSDSDTGSNGIVTYTISPSNTPFGIDASTGVVRLTRRLDFSLEESYTLIITAQDGGTPALTATTVLNVVVIDVTDPPPVFSLSEYTFSVPENQANVLVGQVAASDRANSAAIIQYEQVMKGDVTDTLFSIEESTGNIRLTSATDRESIASYTISIRAFRIANYSDSTAISGVSVVSVIILISDVNDNSPVILNSPADSFSIFETRQVGSVLFSILATDADEGENAAITYSLTAPINGPFSIGSTTGIVRLTGALDFDTTPSYVLVVRAQDGGSPPRSTTTTHTVNITDVQDPPPVFSQSIYNVELTEGDYMNHILLQVGAIDPLHPTAIIRYEQVMRNDDMDSLFTVENSGENAGQIRVTGILDREADTIHTVNIRAFRVATSGSTNARSAIGIVSVILTVLDSNDNSPMWLNPITQPITISETAPIGTVVYSLIVSDLDEGVNGRLNFSVPSTSPFAVTQGGMVTLKEMLTSSVPSHIVPVTVSDQGTPALSSIFQLTVQVTVGPATPPVFSNLVYTVSAIEGDYSAEPLRVVNVTATASTAGCSVAYSIQLRSDSSHTPFSVNTISGAVSFMGVLDREDQRTWIIVIQAREVDPVTSAIKATSPGHATVILSVTDVNDNAPAFVTDHIFGSISESARVGDVAAAGVRAFDSDEGSNGVFAYSLANADPTLPFAVDSVTGVITVSRALDYENSSSYQFSIVAQEVATTQRFSSTAVVNILIVNENDGNPSFPRNVYEFEIAENLPPQSLTSITPSGLAAILATDTDIGVFGDLTYRLLGFGVPEKFSVSSAGAVISTTSSLDYEERSVYHLTLIAEDGGGTLTTPNRAATQINIQVLDVNDHTPQCFPSSTTISLQENIAYPNFFTITGVDGDPPNTTNSRLTYTLSFTDGTPATPLFSINSSTGQISTSALDYEAVPSHMYDLTVNVSDGGSPSLSTTCSLTVNVRDSNDAAPIFFSSVYTGSVTENFPVGSPVGINVAATDPESEHTVTYFTETSDPHSAFFSVERTSGIITLAQSVDYDPPANHREFTFRVLAVDDATPPLTGTATVVINVIPENDNSPIITNPPALDPFNYTLIEGAGEVRPQTLFTVEASDLDGDDLTYNFTTTNNFLSLDSSGAVVLIAPLDRETQSSHTVEIQVCDPGARCRSVTIYINVLDYNDNAPTFAPSSLNPTVSIRECDVRNQILVATVTATDTVDLNPHNVVTYSIVGGNVDRFTVGETSGEIRLRVSPTIMWDFEAGTHSFSVTVRAQDFPGGMPRLRTPVDSVLNLTLTDCNDVAPMFSSSSYTFNIDETTMGPASDMVVFSGIAVSDGDSSPVNAMSTLSIVGAPSSTNGWFGIDPQSGTIHILSGAVVDREDPSNTIDFMGRGVLSFTVLAVNAAPTATLSSTAMVTVTINDINDHDPVIQQMSPLAVSVAEHSDIGTLVTVISAVDTVDYGVNTRIRYDIISGNEDAKFAINSETGVLTVVGDLDHENRTQYRLTVQAREHLGVPASTPDTINVDVTVTGTNDFTPMFDSSVYRASIQEFDSISGLSATPANSVVATVRATDRDGPGSLAGQLEYRITSGAVQLGVEMFAIPNSASGVVTILRPDLLNYEGQQQFVVTIEAYDLVLPLNQRRQNITQLIVSVVDVNDVVPTFLDFAYTGSIAENQPIGSPVAVMPTIRGQDADNNSMDLLTFSILPGPPFAISSDGRTVTTTAVLDRESLVASSYRLVPVVQVRDQAGHTSTATLTVTITDINDNPPCFPPGINTQFSVEEGRVVFPDPMSLVGRVQAMDLDLPQNPLITYFISGGDNGKFDISPQTGEIYVIDQLDREEIPFFTLNITTTDGNLTCGIQVDVTVLERNDNDPIFSQNPYLGSAGENISVGSPVDVNFTTTGSNLQVVATDLDENSVITFSILPQPGLPVPFTVHPQTGFITTNATLDRETVDLYTFQVRADDGMRNSDTVIEIVVLDFNDEEPQFLQESINITVPELTQANFVFLFVEAVDGDAGSNSEIVYSVSAVDPPSAVGLFNINAVRGGIFSTGEVVLNPGDPQTITLTITASNLQSSVPVGFAVPQDTTTVIISIEPQNINAPNFTSPLYMFTVTENLNGTTLGSVLATEPSGDVGTVITYSIDRIGGSEVLNFRIDPVSGSIINIRPFDKEEQDFYQFAVIAMDNAPDPRFGSTTVSVRILDVNDNAPTFRFDPYMITLSEAFSPNGTFLTVFASDRDSGSNAELRYSITGNSTSVFAIDPISGDLRTLVELDREMTDFYRITVSAEDSGTPSSSTLVEVLVTVGDINDNDPYFTGGAVLSNISVEVYENSLPPLNFTLLQASDEDANGNALVVFTFENAATQVGPFQIDRRSGLVSLHSAGSLDRETQDFYQVTVVISDQGGIGPQVRSTSGTFSVRILDRNDSIPTFTDSLFEFEVREDSPVGTTFGQVTGTDADIGSNAILFFHLIGDDPANTTCVGAFCIDHETGILSLLEMVDTETQPVQTISLAVSNMRELEYDSLAGQFRDVSTGSARVEVLDTNDQAPVFIPSSLFAVVEEESEFHTSIAQLRATDVDTDNGSIIWFEITTPDAAFVVDRATGVVTTAGNFRGLTGTKLQVQVRAYDNFGLPPTESTMDTLTVQVFKCGEQIELSFQSQREVIEGNIERIRSALERITEGRIFVTEITVRQTQAGSVDATGTNVKLFTLDSEEDTVVNPEIVIRVLDENYGTLEPLFQEFDLIQVAIESCDVESEDLVSSFAPWVWVILALLLLGLCCICCCCLLVCIGERRKSRKWKNRAYKADQLSQLDQFSHNEMGLNPIWIDPYPNDYDTMTDVTTKSTAERDNPLYESQELTIEMFQEAGATSDEEDGGEPMYESQEILVEMFADDMSDGHSSTRLIKTPNKGSASPQDVDDMLERALDDSDEYDEPATSFF